MVDTCPDGAAAARRTRPATGGEAPSRGASGASAGAGRRRLPAVRPPRIAVTGVAFREAPRRLLVLARNAALAVTGLLLTAGTIAEQDVVAMVADPADAPRWAAAIVAAPHGTVLEPTFTYAGAADAASARVALAAGEATVALSPDVLEATAPRPASADPPRVNRAAKEGRLASVRMASAEAGAGTLIEDKPLIAAPPEDAVPRTAFVRPTDLGEDAMILLAGSAPATGEAVTKIVVPDLDRFHAAAAAATSASVLSAYAADGAWADVESPFRALFGQPDRPHGVSGNGRDHWWSDRPLPEDVTSQEEIECLTRAIYFEARGEPKRGQEAVAQVVINRVKNPAYPDSVCGVVYQNKNWFNRCQFTFACDRVKDRVTDEAAWSLAQDIASRYARGEAWHPDIGASTHYHADYVSPRWAPLMRRVGQIGDHIFYLTLKGGWT